MDNTDLYRILAIEIMGWKEYSPEQNYSPRGYTLFSRGPSYLTVLDKDSEQWSEQWRQWDPMNNMGHAWEIVERAGGIWLCPSGNAHGWQCAPIRDAAPSTLNGFYGATAMEAICLCARFALAGQQYCIMCDKLCTFIEAVRLDKYHWVCGAGCLEANESRDRLLRQIFGETKED